MMTEIIELYSEEGREVWLSIDTMAGLLGREDAVRYTDEKGALMVIFDDHKVGLDFSGKLWGYEDGITYVRAYVRVCFVDGKELPQHRETEPAVI